MPQKKKVFFSPVNVKELTIHTTHHKFKKKPKKKTIKNKTKTKQNKIKNHSRLILEREAHCVLIFQVFGRRLLETFTVLINIYIYIYYLELFILNSSFSTLY